MDNPNVVLDEDDLSEEDPGETIRLRPYLDWRVSLTTNYSLLTTYYSLLSYICIVIATYPFIAWSEREVLLYCCPI